MPRGLALVQARGLRTSCESTSREAASRGPNEKAPNDELSAVNDRLEQVRTVMHDSIEKVLERGERIDLLVEGEVGAAPRHPEGLFLNEFGLLPWGGWKGALDPEVNRAMGRACVAPRVRR